MNNSAKTKYEVIDVNHIEVTVDVSLLPKTDELHFNATAIAAQFGKQPKDWLKTDQSKDYVRVVSQKENIPHRLALPFARWCSVEFEYELDRWIENRIEEEHQRRQRRLEAKTGFMPLTHAIQSAHAEVNAYHFSNECDLINRIVTGMSAKKFKLDRGVKNVRDALTAAQLQLLEKLQRQNTTLIELGFGYDERKRLLTEQAETARCF